MSDREVQIAKSRERIEATKKEVWNDLVAAEAVGEIPEGISIVDMHAEYCVQLEAIHTEFIRELDGVNQRFQETMDKMLDAVNEYDKQHGAAQAAE